MQSPETMRQVYEELAGRFEGLGEPRRRDHCLVLAADAALAAGQTEHAERLRQRLLQLNPHHMLRPFRSMGEALQSVDVQDYIADLRNQMPPESVERLLQEQPGAASAESVYKLFAGAPVSETAAKAATPAKTAPPKPPTSKQSARLTSPPLVAKMAPPPKLPTQTPKTSAPHAAVVAQVPALRPGNAGVWISTLFFLLALAFAGGVFFITFVQPFLR